MTRLDAGLLASGSSYTPRLPAGLAADSDFVRRSSPVTAAGPRRYCTGFPLKALAGHLQAWRMLDPRHEAVKLLP